MAPNNVANGSRALMDVGTDQVLAVSSQIWIEYGIRFSIVVHFSLAAGSIGPPPLNLRYPNADPMATIDKAADPSATSPMARSRVKASSLVTSLHHVSTKTAAGVLRMADLMMFVGTRWNGWVFFGLKNQRASS